MRSPELGRARHAIVVGAVALVVAVAIAGCAPSAPKKAPGGSTAVTHSTPVPAPGGGSIEDVIPSAEPGGVTKAALGDPAKLPSKVTITVTSAKFVQVKAQTPGEIQGPAIAATVKVTNGTSATIDLGSTVVTLTDGSGGLGQPTTSEPSQPFTQEVAAGASLSGVYVFRVPATNYNPITISVSYAGGAPQALFTGSASQ
ncbi:MAG TPA: hypothetical protein VNT53_04365 [Pseudolysinimonas sp.]|nr:hypothetical protein [Pseudolysinimonas sp.]